MDLGQGTLAARSVPRRVAGAHRGCINRRGGSCREIGTTAFAIEYQRKSDEESEKLRARMVTGEIPATLQKQADAEDDALVAQYEGQDVNTWNMGNAGMLVQQARARVAAREAAKVDPVANDARGLRRLRSMFGG